MPGISSGLPDLPKPRLPLPEQLCDTCKRWKPVTRLIGWCPVKRLNISNCGWCKRWI